MVRTRLLKVVLAILAFGAPPLWASEAHDHAHARDVSSLGRVNFPISCSAAAQQDFNLNLALFYSFWYPESIDAFVKLAEKEPGCAMAYWGEAISRFRNPLADRTTPADAKAGWAAIQKAQSAGAPPQRARDYIAPAEGYYRNPDHWDQRARAPPVEKGMAALERKRTRLN